MAAVPKAPVDPKAGALLPKAEDPPKILLEVVVVVVFGALPKTGCAANGLALVVVLAAPKIEVPVVVPNKVFADVVVVEGLERLPKKPGDVALVVTAGLPNIPAEDVVLGVLELSLKKPLEEVVAVLPNTPLEVTAGLDIGEPKIDD